MNKSTPKKALSSGGAGAVNTALFIQNAVQIRNLYQLECEGSGNALINGFPSSSCFSRREEILFWLIVVSLGFQVVYAFYIVVGKIGNFREFFLLD